MLQQRIFVPSSGKYEVPVDIYVPNVLDEVDPTIHRPAVVICPGGGYTHMGVRETEPIAMRFLAHGFNAFVVWYRFAPYRFPVPQQDTAAAVACVRAHAEEWHTDPDRIAVMGFSAGGHLAGSIGTMWQHAELWADMGITPEQVRPNALVLGYAVLADGELGDVSSYAHLTGSNDPAVHSRVSVVGNVTEKCPPTFLWQTFDDGVVKVENALLMGAALAKYHIPCEIHIYPHGPHGSGLCNEQCAGRVNPMYELPYCAEWPEKAAHFLKTEMQGCHNHALKEEEHDDPENHG